MNIRSLLPALGLKCPPGTRPGGPFPEGPLEALRRLAQASRNNRGADRQWFECRHTGGEPTLRSLPIKGI